MSMIDRRGLLGAAAATPLLGALPYQPARAQAANTIRIGMLTDFSGPFRDLNGPNSIAAARRYIYIENQYFTAQKIAGAIRSRPAPAGADALAERERAVRRAALEDAARVASRIGRPAGAGDGDTYVPGSAADAARAIRALMEADDA